MKREMGGAMGGACCQATAYIFSTFFPINGNRHIKVKLKLKLVQVILCPTLPCCEEIP